MQDTEKEQQPRRCSKDCKTPFSVGMSVYAKTRKRTLVEMLHEHGVSISCDKVLEISAQLGDAGVNKYVDDGVICQHMWLFHHSSHG